LHNPCVYRFRVSFGFKCMIENDILIADIAIVGLGYVGL